MNSVKQNVKALADYLVSFVKWMLLSVTVGAIGGTLGSVFHMCIDVATEARMHKYAWLVFLMPVGAVFITFVYKTFAKKGEVDTNLVISSLRLDRQIPLVMIPLIFVSTVVTQLVGGSGGREGAALQLGGSVGYNVGKILKMNSDNMHIIVMAGMASVFSALFGTPLTAAVFSLEVAAVGFVNFTALLPCVISATVAYCVAGYFGVLPVRFNLESIPQMTFGTMTRVIVLSLLCAVVSIVFCVAIEGSRHMFKKLISNAYYRGIILSVLLVLLTLVVGNTDYNGAGMHVIERTMRTGSVFAFAFALKIIFTSITLSAGFKGGEIVPAFFVGTTFGALMSGFLGLDSVFCAAIGFVCLFCGVVNCPLASVFLSIEVFGAEGLLFFAAACGVSYVMSGKFGLYAAQKIMYSKTDGHIQNE